MPSRVSFRELMDLELSAEDVLRASAHPGYPAERVFGGQLLAQALMAAGQTVPEGRGPSSLHACFVAGASMIEPVDYAVTVVRDGRTLSSREVHARQAGSPVFTMMCSFTAPGPGDEWSELGQVASTPAVATTDPALGGSPLDSFPATGSFELRFPHPSLVGPRRFHPCWVRLTEDLGDDPLLNACALAFVSDMGLLTAALPAEEAAAAYRGASLDHAMWFGAPSRAQEWHLVDAAPIQTSGSRGVASGAVTTLDGRRVASFAQEGLFVRAAERRDPQASTPHVATTT